MSGWDLKFISYSGSNFDSQSDPDSKSGLIISTIPFPTCTL